MKNCAVFLCSGNSLIINIPVLNVAQAQANPTTHPTTHSSPLHQSTLLHRSPSGIKQKKGTENQQRLHRAWPSFSTFLKNCDSAVGTHILFPLHYYLSLACQDKAHLYPTPS